MKKKKIARKPDGKILKLKPGEANPGPPAFSAIVNRNEMFKDFASKIEGLVEKGYNQDEVEAIIEGGFDINTKFRPLLQLWTKNIFAGSPRQNMIDALKLGIADLKKYDADTAENLDGDRLKCVSIRDLIHLIDLLNDR